MADNKKLLQQAEPVEPMEPVATHALIEECRSALAEELAAWDINPPLHHVKQAHDKCVSWLATQQQAEPVQRKPLTEEEIDALFKGVDSEDKGRFAIVRGFARAIEAAHGIKEEK